MRMEILVFLVLACLAQVPIHGQEKSPPEIGIHLPDWAGGDLEGSLAEFGVEGGFNMSELSGTGTMKMINGLVEGTAMATLNWDKGTLDSNAT